MTEEPTPLSVLAKRGLRDLVRSGSYRVYHRMDWEKTEDGRSIMCGFTELVFDPPILSEELLSDYAEIVSVNLPVQTDWSAYAEIVGENLVALKFIRPGKPVLKYKEET